MISAPALYVVKQESGHLFFLFLSLQGKSEEDVSSAGEQLTSNRIYDGENTDESFLIREALFCFHCRLWLNKLIFCYLV